MLALLLIDHRVAFLALAALLIAAAIPLAIAWARLLPEEPPPFPIEPGSFPNIEQERRPEPSATPKGDLILSVVLLICLTLAYAIRFPGFPKAALMHWLDGVVSGPTEYWLVLCARIFVIAAAVAAIAYAIRRPGPFRIPLASAAALVLILWFLAPLLNVALVYSQ
jgi:hypothetical protein